MPGVCPDIFPTTVCVAFEEEPESNSIPGVQLKMMSSYKEEPLDGILAVFLKPSKWGTRTIASS